MYMSLLIEPNMQPTAPLFGSSIEKKCKKQAQKGQLTTECIRHANKKKRERNRKGVNKDGTRK